MSKARLILTLASVAGIGAAGASAFTQTFFGLDLNPNFNNPSIDDPILLGAFPNSLAAEANFKSFLTGATTEDFEGNTAEGTPFSNFHLNSITEHMDFGANGRARITAESLLVDSSQLPIGNPSGGRMPTSGTNRVFIPQANGADTVITFEDALGNPNPQAAFGFFGSDVGDFGGMLVVLTQTNGGTMTFDLSSAMFGPQGSGQTANGSVLFFGLIDTDNPFTSITLRNTAAAQDGFAFDDFTIGRLQSVVIPIPAAFGLGAFGLMGVAARRRRRSITM